MSTRPARSGRWLPWALVLATGCGEPGADAPPASDRDDSAAAQRDPAPLEPLNVVVLLVDTLRPDHLGFHGYGQDTAPFLARLAQRSTVFERAHSTSCWTAPSVASLFTGQYPGEHGITVGFFVNMLRNRELREIGEMSVQLNRFRTEASTLPEILQAAGYATFGAAANPNIGPEIGFDRGFDRFQRLFEMTERLDPPAEEMEAAVLAWEDELAASPLSFLYLHLNDPHDPLDPRAPWYVAPDGSSGPEGPEGDGSEQRARYDSEIGYLDAAIERLYGRFGWDQDTLLVVVSDHGEEFYEHGRRGHGTSLYGEQNRILMMLHAPGHVAEGRRIAENVSLVDVLPTLLELLGLESEAPISGRSLAGLARAGAEPVAWPERDVFAHWINPAPIPEKVEEVPDTKHLWAVLRGPWRLVHGDQGTLLFDELQDPGNRSDLAAERPELVSELMRSLEAFQVRESQALSERVEVTLDEAQVEALRKLGYTGESD